MALVACIGGRAVGQEIADPADVVVPADTAAATEKESAVGREAWSKRLSDIDIQIAQAKEAAVDPGVLAGLKARRAKLDTLSKGERRRAEILAEILGAKERTAALKQEFDDVQAYADEEIALKTSREELEAAVEDFERRLGEDNSEIQVVRNALDFRDRRRETLREEQLLNIKALTELSGTEDQSRDFDQMRSERLLQVRDIIDLERKMLEVTNPNLRLEFKIREIRRGFTNAALATLRERLIQTIADEATEASVAANEMLVESTPEVVREQILRNEVLAARLSKAVLNRYESDQQIELKRKQLDQIKRNRIADGQRFDGLTTPEIATLLRERESSLPDGGRIAEEIRGARASIPSLQIELLLLESRIRDVTSIPAQANVLVVNAGLQGPAARTARDLLIPVLEDRIERFGLPLVAALNTRIDQRSQEIALGQALAEEAARYRSLVIEKTLWIRGDSTFSSQFLSLIGAEMSSLFQAKDWMGLAEILLDSILESPIRLALFVVLPPILILALGSRMRRRVTLAGQRVKHAATDSFAETLLVVLFGLLEVLAWTLPLLVVGGILQQPTVVDELARSIGSVLELISIFLFVVGLTHVVVRPGGLAEMHFRWSQRLVNRVRIATWLGFVTLPLGFFERLCDSSRLDLMVAARVFFTPIPLLLAWAAYFVFQPHRGVFGSDGDGTGKPAGPMLRWGLPTLLISVLLTNGLMANLGWYRMVATIQRNVVMSLLLVIVILLLRELLFRALHARHRGTTWWLRRQEVKGEDVSVEVGELEAIEVRTTRAIRFSVVSTSIIGFWAVWSDLLPAFGFLKNVTLWEAGEDGIADPITLLDGLFCLISLVGTYYTTRNLPLILELLVLERFSLDRGMRYACSQVFQWAILIGGLAFSVSLLGISWSSVQWLAAGFTVGLGFGLQEIFANFISGLIILFEQPVRQGDLVSVGETTGTIDRIRMRSTTITDWDRKELVVPNKQFITQEVVNWSMGDACIRLVLPVGVSYGENPRDIVRYLSEIASAHPDVLNDPQPNVAFRAFSDSSLDFDLRVYLAGTDGMSGVRTDLNIAIKERFDLEGVAIPFPQRDIRVEMVRSGEPESGPSIPLPVSDRPKVPERGASPRVDRAGSRGSGVEDVGNGPDGDVE